MSLRCARWLPEDPPSGAPAGHGLDLHEFLEAEAAPFAAVARLLVAAERRGPLVGCTVDVDVAGPHAPGNAACPLHVARGNVPRQPVGGVVGHADGIVLALVADDRQHRPEDLLARNRHVVAYLGEP